MYLYKIRRAKDYLVNEDALKIESPNTIGDAYKEYFDRLDREHFEIVHLNRKNFIVGREVISIGSSSSSIVHPREVFKGAIMNSSECIILMHNHPSGDLTPSAEDRSITRRLIEAGDILEIKVLDHIIFGGGRYVSMKERGDI